MPAAYYLNSLYPLQDSVLKVIEKLGLDFYLTGGTALSRCYLNHRFSDDLDLFVNGHKDFKNQCRFAINALKHKWEVEVATTSDTFVRVFLVHGGLSLKIDFVNDVPFRFGTVRTLSIFSKVDSWRNILSNKLCAVSRLEAKDIADIVFISRRYEFKWEIMLREAKEKDLWVDPLEICRILNRFPLQGLAEIKWIENVNIDELKADITVIHDDIFIGSENSLYKG
jgi:hypothetical protein